MAAATATTTTRYLGRCKHCKRAKRVEVANGFADKRLVTCKCGMAVRVSKVYGWVNPSVKCHSRCTGAVGPSCDCSCGGANHGSAHAC